MMADLDATRPMTATSAASGVAAPVVLQGKWGDFQAPVPQHFPYDVAKKRLDFETTETDEALLEYTNICLSPSYMAFDSRYTPRFRRGSPAVYDDDGTLKYKAIPSRNIRILVCITGYNEDGEELMRTLSGVCDNVAKLHPQAPMRKNVAVCIVMDGLSKMNPDLEQYCQGLNLFFPEIIRHKDEQGHTSQMHVFERTILLPKHKTSREYHFPLPVAMCVKARNGGKLNSHLWFFRGFAQLVDPEFVILLDIGTKPAPGAFRRIDRAFRENEQIIGVCGEISVKNPKVYSAVVSAQQFEYKISHVLDKAMESVFGYITVLPGAFSAYSFKCFRDTANGPSATPLDYYFKTEETSIDKMSPFEANMFLAEDRVLCLEILAAPNQNWTMHYVAGAVADTDVPQTFVGLIKQRRRWLNGAFFSMLYSIQNFGRIMRESGHNPFRKLFLAIQFLYMSVLVVLNWLSPGALYLSFYVVFLMAVSDLAVGAPIMFVFSLVYIFCFLILVIAALGNDIKAVGKLYVAISAVYGIMAWIATIIGVWHAFRGTLSPLVQIVSLSSLLVYVVGALAHGDLLLILSVFVQYVWLLPSLVNILPVYSFCNVHDISWGTKEGDLRHEKARAKDQQKSTLLASTIELKKQQSAASESKNEPEPVGNARPSTAATTATKVHNRNLLNDEEVVLKIGLVADGGDGEEQRQLKEKMNEVQRQFKLFRLRLLSLWLACNFTFVLAIVQFQLLDDFLLWMLILVLFSLSFRLTGSLIYQFLRVIKFVLRRCCGGADNPYDHDEQPAPVFSFDDRSPTHRSPTSYDTDTPAHRRGTFDSVMSISSPVAGRPNSVASVGRVTSFTGDSDQFTHRAVTLDQAPNRAMLTTSHTVMTDLGDALNEGDDAVDHLDGHEEVVMTRLDTVVDEAEQAIAKVHTHDDTVEHTGPRRMALNSAPSTLSPLVEAQEGSFRSLASEAKAAPPPLPAHATTTTKKVTTTTTVLEEVVEGKHSSDDEPEGHHSAPVFRQPVSDRSITTQDLAKATLRAPADDNGFNQTQTWDATEAASVPDSDRQLVEANDELAALESARSNGRPVAFGSVHSAITRGTNGSPGAGEFDASFTSMPEAMGDDRFVADDPSLSSDDDEEVEFGLGTGTRPEPQDMSTSQLLREVEDSGTQRLPGTRPMRAAASEMEMDLSDILSATGEMGGVAFGDEDS